MKNIYKAKNYFEEILLGSNLSGLGFINESSHNYFQKSHLFSDNNRSIDFSGEILSVGLLNQNLLEIGVNSRIAGSSYYRNHLKKDICRNLAISEEYVIIQAKTNYSVHLNLNAGSKVAHKNLAVNNGWGTLGGILLPQKPNGVMHIISNNHVLANSNRAITGDDIFYMEETPIKIGKLKHYTPIKSYSANYLDLAVAEIPGFRNNGLLPGSNRDGFIGEKVYKVGARTGMTNGVVRSMHYTAKIDFPDFKAVFVDQMQITGNVNSFSQPGDSGSLIRSGIDNSCLGLLFAGNDQWTLANHQSVMFNQLNQWGYNLK